MSSQLSKTVSELGDKIASLYREIVTNTVQFEELRKYTRESIDEFKRLLERNTDRVDRIERDRIRVETELISKINALEARLNALSEQALHLAAEKAAVAVMERALKEGQMPSLPSQGSKSLLSTSTKSAKVEDSPGKSTGDNSSDDNGGDS